MTTAATIRTEHTPVLRTQILGGYWGALKLSALFWFLVIFSTAFQWLMDNLAGGSKYSTLEWLTMIRQPIVRYGIWIFIAPIVLRLGYVFPVDSARKLANLRVHAAVYLGLTILQALVRTALHDFTFPGNDHAVLPTLAVYMTFGINTNLWLYIPTAGLGQMRRHYAELREREQRAAQLQQDLANAQLHLLKAQLHPHFLFNTLHSISALMQDNVKAADRMMTELSDLLRVTFENAGVQETSLKRELDFVRNYLNIEQTRFGDNLVVDFEIQPDTLDATVPYLIFQPLIENAVRHGTARLMRPGHIEVLSRREGEELVLLVRDNGPGMQPKAAPRRPGVGIRNTRARLEQLYGQRESLRFHQLDPFGTEAEIRIPFAVFTGEADSQEFAISSSAVGSGPNAKSEVTAK